MNEGRSIIVCVIEDSNEPISPRDYIRIIQHFASELISNVYKLFHKDMIKHKFPNTQATNKNEICFIFEFLFDVNGIWSDSFNGVRI